MTPSDDCPPVIGHDDRRPPYTKLPAPVQSIPADIIREVFISNIPQKLDYCRPSSRTAPLQVSHVCSSWRLIALDTPQLWSSVAIRATFSGSETTEMEVVERRSDVIRQWNLRPGQYQALSLQYDGYELGPSADIVGIILPHLNQLSELMIQLDDALPLYNLFATAELERLEILDFSVPRDDDGFRTRPQDRLSF